MIANTIKSRRVVARAEGRPKEIMELVGWTILTDGKQFIVSNGKKQLYVMTLENALYEISQQVEKDILQREAPNLNNVVEILKESREWFVEAIAGEVIRAEKPATVAFPQPSSSYNASLSRKR